MPSKTTLKATPLRIYSAALERSERKAAMTADVSGGPVRPIKRTHIDPTKYLIRRNMLTSSSPAANRKSFTVCTVAAAEAALRPRPLWPADADGSCSPRNRNSFAHTKSSVCRCLLLPACIPLHIFS